MGSLNTAAAKEVEKARAFFASATNLSESFTFAVYKRPEVREALEALFQKKCAYCESKYLRTAPTDIEHYRPKGGVVDPPGTLQKPGYWWLAADWENLLPSCIDCNRARWQATADGELHKRGKENLFPVFGARNYPLKEGSEKSETAVLLDPCRDSPEHYLHFGEGGVVRIRPGLARRDIERGRVSIQTYGLDRHELTQARNDTLLRAIAQTKVVVQAMTECAKKKDSDSRSTLRAELCSLSALLVPSAEYAAVARSIAERLDKPQGVAWLSGLYELPPPERSLVDWLIQHFPPPKRPSAAEADKELRLAMAALDKELEAHADLGVATT